MLASKFRGCLAGACVGDCLGSPYETKSVVNKSALVKHFDTILSGNARKIYKFTDDTAMLRSVSNSLIAYKEFNAVDMADRFQSQYFKEPDRGYGDNVINIFSDLKNKKFKDVYESAKQQFNGSGSYGNGAAMRTAPIPLAYLNNESLMVESAINAAKLTHSNQLGITGAVLLSHAIRQALLCNTESLDAQLFLSTLKEKINSIDIPTVLPKQDSNQEIQVYIQSLENISELLQQEPSINTVVQTLGNTVTAHKSVPASIYSFLRGLSSIDDFGESNKFVRIIQYSILLGGDTDTIASMAGSVAGAYLGYSAIPEAFASCCEGFQEACRQADSLYEISQNY